MPSNTTLHSSIHPGWSIFASNKGKTLHCNGWCWDSAWEGGGTPPMTVRLSVDGRVVATMLANLTKKDLMNATGAPNREHGFAITTASSWVQTLSGAGRHKLELDVFLDERPSAESPTAAVRGSPLCFVDGKPVVPPPGDAGLPLAPPPSQHLGPLAANLMQRLAAISASDSFVFGQQRSNTEGLAPVFVDCDAARFPNGTAAWAGCDSTAHGSRSDVKSASGSQAGLIAYDYDWAIETTNWQDLSNASNASRRAIPPHFDYARFMTAAHAEGALVAMDSPMRNPITLRDQCDTTGRPITALLPGGAGHLMWTTWLDGIAAVAAAEAARGHAMIFRLFHEVTRVHCYWWAQGAGVTPAEYHAAWNYTRWYLEEHRQVDNLLFAYAPWQPSRYPGKSYVEWTEGGFYPGDENVDIISFDNYDVDETFTTGMLKDCRAAVAFAVARGKIPAAGEFGTLGGTQNTHMKHWFTEAFLNPLLRDPMCRRIAFALTWANGPMDYPPAVLLNPPHHTRNEHYVPVPGDVAYDDFVNFLASNATLLARDLLRGETGGGVRV
jgi:hypothetical protein